MAPDLRWDDGLVGPALRIAGTPASPLKVTAGPGTGKTFCLKRRVVRLLQEGQDPTRIFVCAFTRTAALSLKREIAALGVHDVDKVRTMTIHSYCFSLLSQNDVLELTGRTPRTLLDFEERFLLEDLKNSGIGLIKDLRDTLQAFTSAWARLQTDAPGWPQSDSDQRFHAAFLAWLRFHRAMLVGELVPEALKFLSNNPGSDYRQAFEHVLVDEYQDLNRSEQDLLDLVAGQAKLVVIGDEDQSIYSFKHAYPEGIQSFSSNHPGTIDEALLVCRRCPRKVVAMANHLISYNTTRTGRQLAPLAGASEGEVHLVQWKRMEEEAVGVSRFIRYKVNSGQVAAGDVLVLAPRRHFGYGIRDTLNSLGVPAHSFFQEEALDGDPKDVTKCQAQIAFTLLSLVVHPEDRVALRCWCGFGSPSLRAGAWARLRGHCEESGTSPRAALDQLSTDQLSLPNTQPLVLRYRELVQALQVLENLDGEKLVDSLFPEGETWADPFRALAAAIVVDEVKAEVLLTALRDGIIQPELPVDVDYVRVMSLHKSKGLTAKLVVILGCLQGLIPSFDDDVSEMEALQHLEEQRRLFYVGLTRTTDILVLSSVSRLPNNLAFTMRARTGHSISRFESLTIACEFLSQLGPEAPQGMPGRILLSGVDE